MTTARQILRYVRRLGQIPESGARILNRSVRSASTQTRHKIVDDGNGKKIFTSPYGDFTPTEMFIQDYVWKNLGKYGNKTALVCAVTGRKYTYNEARDAANYVARSLVNLGLRKGDNVALIAPNYPESILAFLGILEANLVVSTVSPSYTAHEMTRQLMDCRANAVITVGEISTIAHEASKGVLAPGAPFVVIDDGTGVIPAGSIPFMDLITKGKTLPPVKMVDGSVEDMAVLPYSSGTTGLPKGVMLSHKNLVANMEMVEKSANGEMWVDTTADFQEVVPAILPFFHIFGMNAVTLPRMVAGSKIITVPKFTPEVFVDMLAKHRVTGLFLVPPIVLFLNACSFIKREHLSGIHHAVSGAAPLSESDVQRFYEKYQMDTNHVKFCQGFGLTETSPVVCLEQTGLKTGSVGKNVAGCDLRLVDPLTNDDVSSPGQPGEMWVRGHHIMKGYFNNESATRETIVENGWLKTGDIAYYDEQLDFFVTDRLKELIKVKGFQVPPAELEALLRMHPSVQEAAVVGIPDKRCGEVPKAFILPKKGAKPAEEDIKDFLKGKVSEYKELKGGVTFVDHIPISPSGKILRKQLKEKYMQ